MVAPVMHFTSGATDWNTVPDTRRFWTISLANLAAAPRPPLEPEKTCGRCKQTKPVSQFYIMGGRIGRTCKACHKAQIYAKRKKS